MQDAVRRWRNVEQFTVSLTVPSRVSANLIRGPFHRGTVIAAKAEIYMLVAWISTCAGMTWLRASPSLHCLTGVITKGTCPASASHRCWGW